MSTDHAFCLGQAGLTVFAATADQRYLLGPDMFLRTHFPITLRRFEHGRNPELIHENAFLARLLTSAPASQGNRVFVLYGAAGSGKSELMRWLQTRVEREAPTRAQAMVRVARTELDALTISEKFRHLVGQGYFDEATHRRWEIARQKPRTLTKLLVLSALENLLDDDEIINSLFYRLTNAVQPHLTRCLRAAEEPGAVDILSREVWEEVVSETVLPVPLEFEALRHQMLAGLRAQLLDGLQLTETLGLISERIVQQQSMRPILLVDDLVQSLNLFATDILDYFVTLESGQWDVVLGLTPAAFEATQRGRELLQRITYLDTLDDRLSKLWLSDDAGSESYFLNEHNCHSFAACYLREYRNLNVQAASQADINGPCLSLDGDNSLCPFNREALVRVFRGLPTGKGKARYFLSALRDILDRAGKGEPLVSTLAGLAKPDGAARCPDPAVARAAELYGPLVTNAAQIILSANVVHFLGLGEAPIKVEMEPLTRRHVLQSPVVEVVDDEEKAAIRDWLLGQAVNRQLLKGVRRGTARWLRAVAAPDLLYRDGIAKPHGVLRWRHTYLDTTPPIYLDGVDEADEGIRLTVEIGSLSFDLHRYAGATGREARQLLAQLAADPRILPVLLSANDLRRKAIERLESQIGMSTEELSLRLSILFYIFGGKPLERPIGVPDEFWAQVMAARARCAPRAVRLPENWGEAIQPLFEDWFKLRENVYDGPTIRTLLSGHVLSTLLAPLLWVKPRKLDQEYWLGKQRLGDVLTQVCSSTESYFASERVSNVSLSVRSQDWLGKFQAAGNEGLPLSEMPASLQAELQAKMPDFYAALRVLESSHESS